MRIANCRASAHNAAMSTHHVQPPPESHTRMERRWGIRIDVDLPVRLELADGRRAPGRMRNASISGALIECAVELPTFTILGVEILGGAEFAPARAPIAARVVRAEHPCLAVAWRN